MNESNLNTYDVSEEEITQVRRRPAEIIALRKQVYLVVADHPEVGIQELGSISPEGFSFEDEQSNEYYTHDLSKAAVRYAELITASSSESKVSEEVPGLGDDEIVFIEDFDEDLGLNQVEARFFQ